MEELLDVFDGDCRKTGKVLARGMPLGENEFFMAVHVWIVNSNGQFFIQKRTKNTKFMPDKWSITGGAVDAGEEPIDAAFRETLEEVGVKLDKENMQYLMTQRDPVSKYFWDSVWLARADFSLDEVVADEQEVAGVDWVSLAELREIIEEGRFAHNVLFVLDKVIETAGIKANE